MSKWEKVKLGDIGEAFIGLTYKPDDVSNEGTIVLRSGNIQDQVIDLNDIVRVTKKVNSKLMLKLNDILICSRNGSARLVGKSAIIDKLREEMTFGAFMMVYRSDYNTYVRHFLNSQIFRRQLGTSATTTINQITKKMFDEILVPLPPLDVQKQIAQNLDTVSELLALRKKQLEELDGLIKSVFYDMFGDPVTNDRGWKIKRLQDITSLITKGSSPNWQGIEYVDDSSKVLFVTSENVRVAFLDLTKPKYLEDKFNEIQPRSILQKGDILVNIVGASIGRAAIFDLEAKANINQAVSLVRCLESECLVYLVHYLNSPKALRMYSNMQVDVARANLSLKNINDLEIIYPPLSLQNEFATIVTKVEEQKALVKQSIEETQTLFDSLMSQYFD